MTPLIRPTDRWLVARVGRIAAVAASALCVLLMYYWTADRAGGLRPAGSGDYYNLLVRGFRKGHLYMDLEPSRELLALDDPYDPAKNGPYRVTDASLYNQRYHLYFGPTPAVVLLWPVDAVTGLEMPSGTAVLVFCSVGFLAGGATWLAFRRRYFPTSSAWVPPLGILAFGLGTHLLALLSRPMWRELAIAGGFCFGMLAMAAAYRAVHGERRTAWLAAAALCLGLAVGARPTWILAAGMLVPPVWLARSEGRRWRRMALAAGVVLGACVAALAVYNFARFGSFLEFGQKYQLSFAYESRLEHFSLRYSPGNLRDYFLGWPGWTWEFPFVSVTPVIHHVRGYLASEGVAGLGTVCPVVWFAAGLPLAFAGRTAAERRAIASVLAGLTLCFLGTGAALWCLFSVTARYMADFSPALVLLGLCGALAVGRACRMARPLVFLAMLLSAGFGFLLMFDTSSRAFLRLNPGVRHRYESACRDALGSLFVRSGLISGPRVIKVRFDERPKGTVETFWQSNGPLPEERILVERLGPGLLRFGYLRRGSPIVWGRPLSWVEGHTHTVELQLPTLYGADPGWLGGFVRWSEFRQRSCAVIRFSGGLELGTFAEPAGDGAARGGFIPDTFSGRILAVGTRPFRDDEMAPPVESAREPNGRPGGSLILTLRLPQELADEGEPLFAGGAMYASDMVFIRESGHRVIFVFHHFGSNRRESAGVELDPHRAHRIAIRLPSFSTGAFGGEAPGEVILSVDGLEVMRTRAKCFGFTPSLIGIGWNPFGTSCGKEFRGWLVDAQWSGADP